MRIRSGFVSNSSSASFIVWWKPYCPDWSIHENLENLLEYADDSLKYMKEIEDNTIENDQGTYKTSFWTTMYNGVDDFGEAATKLVGATVIKGLFTMCVVEED